VEAVHARLPRRCDHPGKQPPHDAGDGGLQRSGSRPADSWIPNPVQAGPSTRRSMATAASYRGPREQGRVRAQHDHPERRTDPARSFSGTHREKCLTPQESPTIDTYPRESRLPSNRTKALQIRYFSLFAWFAGLCRASYDSDSAGRCIGPAGPQTTICRAFVGRPTALLVSRRSSGATQQELPAHRNLPGSSPPSQLWLDASAFRHSRRYVTECPGATAGSRAAGIATAVKLIESGHSRRMTRRSAGP
jgi:hypothetical protein